MELGFIILIASQRSGWYFGHENYKNIILCLSQHGRALKAYAET